MDNHHRAPALPLQPAPPSPPQTLAARSFSEKETDVDYSKAFPFLLEINKVLQVQGSPWDSDKAIYHPVWLSQFDHTEPKEANGPTGQFCLCVDAPFTLLPRSNAPSQAQMCLTSPYTTWIHSFLGFITYSGVQKVSLLLFAFL